MSKRLASRKRKEKLIDVKFATSQLPIARGAYVGRRYTPGDNGVPTIPTLSQALKQGRTLVTWDGVYVLYLCFREVADI